VSLSYSSQIPNPVALVTVATGDHQNVMTAAWVTPVSADPPILMVSIRPSRFTHDLILEAKEFGVSVLADDQKKLSEIAGTLSGKKKDKLALPGFESFAGKRIKAPLVKGAHAWFECVLHSYHTAGDHTAFYGTVIETKVDETKPPLVLFQHKYYALGEVKGVYP
jgi:flavin reductase (DIM6/NTAB) family NADH-FMN oxidoreductase RutF